MKVLRKFKKVFITLMAMAILGSTDLVRADENIASGIYTIKNSVYHENETGMAMARSYVDEEMTVKITNEEVVFTIGFSGSEFMNNHRIKVNGEEVNIQIVEEDAAAGTIKVQASAPSIDSELSAAIYVDPMGRDVEFAVIPDYSTLVLIEAIEEIVEETAVEVSENDTVSNDKETAESVNDKSAENNDTAQKNNNAEITEAEDSKSNKGLVIGCGIAGLVVLAGITAVAMKKRK